MKLINKITAAAVLALLTILLAAGCSDGTTTDIDQVVTELKVLSTDLVGMEAAYALMDKSLIARSLPGSRTITVTTTDVDGRTIFEIGDPDTVFVDFGGTLGGTDPVRVPNTGNGANYNGTNDTFFFTMTPVAGGYKINLTVNPRTDFTVESIGEEYYVTAADPGWTNYDSDSFTSTGFSDLRTNYTDNTWGVRTIEEVSDYDAGTNDTYTPFNVPEDILGNLSLYDYPATIPTYSMNSAGNFSVKELQEINGRGTTTTSTSYYTESTVDTEGNPDTYSGVSYIFTSHKGNAKKQEDIWTVNRFFGTYSEGTKTVRNLTTTGDQWWRSTETEEILFDYTDTGALHYTSTNDVFYEPPEMITDLTSSNQTIIDVEETAAGSGRFTGTITYYWGQSGGVYNVVIDSSSAIISTQWVGAATRGVNREISLADLEELVIDIPGGGQFTGYYEAGTFIGTYISGGSTYNVVVATGGVLIEDQPYTFQ